MNKHTTCCKMGNGDEPYPLNGMPWQGRLDQTVTNLGRLGALSGNG